MSTASVCPYCLAAHIGACPHAYRVVLVDRALTYPPEIQRLVNGLVIALLQAVRSGPHETGVKELVLSYRILNCTREFSVVESVRYASPRGLDEEVFKILTRFDGVTVGSAIKEDGQMIWTYWVRDKASYYSALQARINKLSQQLLPTLL